MQRRTASNETEIENQLIIMAFRNNDSKVIEQCYARTQPVLKKLIYNNSGNEEDVKNVQQYCFMTFFKYCQKEDFRLTSQFSTFIYSIAYRYWMKTLRRRKKETSFDIMLENIPQESDNELETAEIDRVVRDVFSNLSMNCQKLIAMKFEEELTHSEIADLLEITVGSSRLKLARCKNKLAKYLIEDAFYQDILLGYPFLKKLL